MALVGGQFNSIEDMINAIVNDGGNNGDAGSVFDKLLAIGTSLSGQNVTDGSASISSGDLAQINMISAAAASRGGGGPGM